MSAPTTNDCRNDRADKPAQVLRTFHAWAQHYGMVLDPFVEYGHELVTSEYFFANLKGLTQYA